MSKSLIITEKPSVAQEFAKILHVSGRRDGFLENDEYVITWCVGHLVEMVYPEDYDPNLKKWRLEDLPFLPETYKYNVIPNVKKQYEIVHEQLHREDIDKVYWAGDAGREGQTIEENIRRFGGVREGMDELRVWIDSQTEEEILRGIKEAKPMSDYSNLGDSGEMRSIEDYAMGINFSRAMSVRYGKLLNDAAATKSYTAIAVGRVMTCVLGMVVEREREIRNFTETPFYRVVGKFSDMEIPAEWKAVEGSKYFNSPLLYKENGFKKEESALALIDELQGKEAKIISLDKSTSKKRAPLLFNLAELQAECSKRFKISPNQTLDVAQELYEKKLTTYPRTDARVLSTAIAKEIGKNLYKLQSYEPTKEYVGKIIASKSYTRIANTSYTDDSKVTDHYAIIPTGQLSELDKLSSLQRNVYDMIVRRFLSIFMPPAEYEQVKMVVGVENEKFFTSAKVLKVPGYLEVANPPKKKSFEEENSRILGGQGQEASDAEKDGDEDEIKVNPKVLMDFAERYKAGDSIDSHGYEIKFGKTSPPKRYTSGSMVLAMENAGQLIEDEELREQIKGCGIGTSATRAETIQKLVRIGYLNLNQKTQILTPEALGEMTYEVVLATVPALLNPQMTASWEKGLDGIYRGTVLMGDYRKKLEDYIRRETLKLCGEDLTQALAPKISQFAGREGKGIGAKRNIGVKCPLCGGDITTTPFGFGCSNYKKDKTGCNFNIGEIAGITLNDEQVKALIEEGRTDTIKGFKGKSGKKFNAALVFKKEANSDADGFTGTEENPFDSAPGSGNTGNNNAGSISNRGYQIEFDFAEVEPEIVADIACPWCGGQIRKTSFGFGCANFKAEDPNSCKFSIGQIAGKSLSAANVKQLLTEGKTETLRGFKSKNGKKFDACLIMKKDENGKEQITFDFDSVEDKLVKDVKCPMCGGQIKVTSFGYGCTNYNRDDPNACKFSIGKLLGKGLTESQVKQLLTDGRTETIRGFKSKMGKKFDARVVLSKDESGKITGLKFDFNDLEPLKLKDVVCPKCGGDIIVTQWGYRCANNIKDKEGACDFFIGQIASVKLKEAQVKELLLTKKLPMVEGFVAKTGMKFDAPLKLTEEGNVAFDFPEKPKPVETTVDCPRCKAKKLMKSQWYFECDCGFKVGHTIAQVPLTDEIATELFTTGETKERVIGFTSKAGNQFDAYLKFEDEKISFVFDKPGEDNNSSAKDDSTPFMDAISDADTEAILNSNAANAEETVEKQNESQEIVEISE